MQEALATIATLTSYELVFYDTQDSWYVCVLRGHKTLKHSLILDKKRCTTGYQNGMGVGLLLSLVVFTHR